jgi:hypothetical protein
MWAPGGYNLKRERKDVIDSSLGHARHSIRKEIQVKRILPSAVILLAVCGCQPNVNEIGQQVSNLLQQKINEDRTLSQYGLVVTSVVVLREEGNKYKGIADVMMSGEKHEVSLDIIADGDRVMYEADPASFLFVAGQPLRQSPRLINPTPQVQPQVTNDYNDPQRTQSGGTIGEFRSTSP